VQHKNLKKEDIMKKEKIIAYRRRCRKIGTGLSHYILLSPKEEKKE
jgi:modified peptide precursor CbpA